MRLGQILKKQFKIFSNSLFFVFRHPTITLFVLVQVVGIISKLKDKEGGKEGKHNKADIDEICAELEQVLENIKSSELYTPYEVSSRESFIGGGIA